MKLVAQYVSGVFKSISQLLNALLGGSPKMTFSARLGSIEKKGFLPAHILCGFLSIFFFWESGPGHCQLAYEADRKRTRSAHDRDSEEVE